MIKGSYKKLHDQLVLKTTYTFGYKVTKIYFADIMNEKVKLFMGKAILLIEDLEKEWGEIRLIDNT